MIKSLVINNLLSLSKKNKRRFLIITNIAISFVIAAIVTSFVSIYYENKLIELRKNLTKLNYDQMIAQEWLSDTGNLLKDNKDYDFLNTLIRNYDKKIYNVSEGRFYFHILMWSPKTVQLAIKDGKLLNLTPELYTASALEKVKKRYSYIQEYYPDVSYLSNFNLKEFTLQEMETITNEILSFVLNTDKKLFYYSKPTLENLKKDEKYFYENKNLEITIKHQLSKLEVMAEILNDLFRIKNLSISKEIIEIEESILNATNNSSKTILYAFLLQVLIFLIIQIFEIREVK